jgi:inhibitor of KinA
METDFFPASDSTLLVRLDSAGRSMPEVNEEVLALASRLQRDRDPRILNLHPAYTTLLIRFDPLIVSHPEMEALVRERLQTSAQGAPEGKLLHVPVCYGSAFGPDLEEVARLTGLTPAEVIEIHSSVNYRVFCLGFTPGFPYLGGMDARIAVPRLDVPRKKVVAGSVGIGGEQTGIYPVASPGGWRLIGRSPLKLLNADHAIPSLILPGDTVRFTPIAPAEFEKAVR